jgi:hypothetical protein
MGTQQMAVTAAAGRQPCRKHPLIPPDPIPQRPHPLHTTLLVVVVVVTTQDLAAHR